jgi:hypothetical protein
VSEVIFRNRIAAGGRTVLDYTVKRTGITETPVALVLRCLHYRAGRTEACGPEREGALYFDRWGRIVDRAPMTPHTSARRLQDLYAWAVREDLAHQAGSGDRPLLREVEPCIGGFFRGEEGIARVHRFPGKDVVHREV